ncbi:RidA family protein [Patulibacter defluvii]|uniref:RidA family protein n=1 Tax=Patulibacter defluvii TaxID=3095358 RepID=UPI002A75E353|nr:RidA family protein [Patulibacter sp. DM4]
MTNEIVTAPGLAPPSGYAHAVVAGPGRTVYLGGQTALDANNQIAGDTLVEQFEQAAANVVEALAAAGGKPEHLVSLQIFVTDVVDYRLHARELGAAWRNRFGRHFPAMGLFGVTRLFDDNARIELMGIAVVPEGAAA